MGVENLVVTATTASAITFANAAGTTVNISGVTSVTNLASAGALTLTNMTTIPEITVNNTALTTNVTFATGVLSGTADTVTLNVIGAGISGTNAIIDVAGGYAGVEGLVINAKTAASFVKAEGNDGLGGGNSSVKTVTVTGDADLTLAGSAFAKVTSFDGSTATGGITASFATFGSGTTNAQTITTGAGKDVITLGQNGAQYASIKVNTGAGDDKVVVGTTLSSKHSIDGGAGKDTLSINTGGTTITVDNVALVNNQTSNFEVMEFANRVDVLNASSFTGFTDYVFTTASVAADPAQTVITGLSSSNTLTFRGDLFGVAGATSVTDGKSALSLAASGTKQTAKLTLNSNETLGDPVTVAGNVTVDIIGGAGGNAATINAGKVAQSAITFGAGIDTLQIAATTAVNIIGGAGGDGADSAVNNTTGGKGGDAAAAIANGTAVKTVVITGDGAVTIKGGAAGDASSTALQIGAGGTASTNGFTGAVTVNASALKGALDIQGSAGEDTIIGGKGADIIRAGGSNDTIDITAGGANKVFFEADAAANGVDTIKGFVVGSGSSADKLDLHLFNIDTGGVAANAAIAGDLVAVSNLSGATAVQAGKITIVDFKAAIGTVDFGTATGFAELFGAGKALSDVQTAAATAKSVVVVQGTDRSEVYFVDNAATDGIVAAEVTLHAAGGLPVAYCQLLSMGNIQTLGLIQRKLAEVKARMPEMTDQIDVDGILQRHKSSEPEQDLAQVQNDDVVNIASDQGDFDISAFVKSKQND